MDCNDNSPLFKYKDDGNYRCPERCAAENLAQRGFVPRLAS